ncbi:MAG: MMPL family transporter [Candidatus Kariarchaeaceae archaeon]
MGSFKKLNFVQIIQEYNKPILVLGLLIYVFFIPIGLRTGEILGADLRVQNISDDQEITSFSSLRTNIIVVVDGNENIISQEFKDWLDLELFEIKNHPTSRATLTNNARPTHIFNQFDNVLTSYLSNLFFATAFANISTYILINGTQELIGNFDLLKSNATTSYPETALNVTFKSVDSQLLKLSTGYFYQTIAQEWLNKTVQYLVENPDLTDPYEALLIDWRNNPKYWLQNTLLLGYEDIISELFNNLDSNTIWEEDLIISLVSAIVYNTDDDKAKSFIQEIFDGGNSTHPTLEAKKQLIPFIRGDYNPYGLSTEVSDLLRNTFSNNKNGSEITSIVIQYRLKSGISPDQLNDIFNYFTKQIETMSDSNRFGYEFAIMSLLNYQKERGEGLNEEFQRLDILTVVLVLMILIIWLKDIRLILISLSLAWTTTQATKGLLISLVPSSVYLIDVSVSVGSALLFGAALNYTIFFAFRYREERESNSHEDSVIKATRTAIHSIYISGVAIFLTFIPLTTSSLKMIVGLTYIAAIGILIELLLLAFLIPSVYLNLSKFLSGLNFTGIKKIKMRGLNVNYNNYKKYVIFSLIVLILSIAVIFSTGANLSADDYVGEGGQTDKANSIFSTHYPSNYFSKILMKVRFESITNSTLVESQYLALSELTNQLILFDGISEILSFSHPFGTEVPFNTTLNLIEDYTYSLLRNELISSSKNETYIIISLTEGPNSNEALRTTENILEYILNFDFTNSIITDIGLSGFTLTNLSFEQSVTSELFMQILLSLLLLTGFLWYQFRSLSVPIRLEITIITGSLYALALGSIIWGLLFSGVLNLLINTTAIIILLGLGADFDVYLYSRIKEEYENRQDYLEAINTALVKSGPAIRTSGLAMAFSFFSLIFGKIILTRQFGLVTFLAVIIDIYFIRTILVPAILLLRHNPNRKE